MSSADAVVAAQGVAPNGDTWVLKYRPEEWGARHYLAFYVNGALTEDGAGFEIPDRTEIGFAGGFKQGQGNRYIYGLVTSRIAVVRAETLNERSLSEAPTIAFPAATTADGSPLRIFVIVRPPVEDVTALVGLDRSGQVVQRIFMVGAPRA